MSQISTRTTVGVFMASYVLLIMVMSCFGSLVLASTSVVAWNIPTTSALYHNVDNLSNLLVARVESGSNTLAKAKQIIQDMSSSSTCSHGPIVRLIQQCKNIKPKHENPHSNHQLNNAESVYAISMALCEAQQAQVRVPQACQIFENMLERPVSVSSVEVIRPVEIEACSAVLYGTPGWTSYSTFKSNSKYLCDSSRADYQQEELLQVLRDANGVIPEILDALNGHHFEAQTFMTELRESAVQVSSAQQDILLRANEQGRLHAEQLRQLTQHVEVLQKSMIKAVGQNSKVLDLSTAKASAVESKLTELYAIFAEVASGVTFDFEQQTALLTGEVTSMVQQIQNFSAQQNLEQIQEKLGAVAQSASEIAQLQAENLANHREALQAIDNLGLGKLLNRFVQASSSISGLIVFVRTEWALCCILGAPAISLAMFGRYRFAISLLLAYASIRAVWSFLPPHTEQMILPFISNHVNEVKYFTVFAAPSLSLATFGLPEYGVGLMSSYFFGRFICAIWHIHKISAIKAITHPDVQSAAKYFTASFVVCFCAFAAYKIASAVTEQPVAVADHVFERRSKHDVKEDFERSRRACSVPLDCESA